MRSYYILSLLIISFWTFACENTDADDCSVLISGQIIDIQTGEPIDSIQAMIEYSAHPDGQMPVTEVETITTYTTSAGYYEFEVGCHTIPTTHRLDFIGGPHRNYYTRFINTSITDNDEQQDILMCPNTRLRVKLNQVSDQCDHESTYLNSHYSLATNSDLNAKWFDLPVSSDITFQFISSLDGEVQQDTLGHLETIEGETLQVEFNY